MSLGERIKKIIGDYSLKEFGEILSKSGKKYTSSDISKYIRETVKPSFNFFLSIHKIFNVNINWLLTGEGSMYNTDKDKSKDEIISQLQTDLNEKDKQLQRIRAAAGDIENRVDKQNSEITRIRAAEAVIVDKLSKKSKLKKK